MDADYCSLCIVGDGATGKSSIISAFKQDGFVECKLGDYKQTIGIDFFEKKMKMNEKYISLRVFDVGGQSINSNNLQNYISNSDVIFMNYDVTNMDSFRNLDDWLIKVRTLCTKNQKLYLVGNKVDLYNLRQVKETDHDNFIQNNECSGGFFMSAKTGENVVKSFYQVAAESKGIKLTTQDLATWDKVLKAHIVLEKSKNEGRTTYADEIERQDREAEEKRKKRQDSDCQCCCS